MGMPTIAFVSPKGGVEKTTSAFLLSAALAKLYDVTIIDADPNHPIQTWASGGNTPPRLNVVSDADEDTIIERIEDSATKTPFVVVDLEGTASKTVIYAISQADFVIVPTQGSQLDANEASRAIRVVLQSAKMTGRVKPYAVLLTRTNSSIRTRGLAHIHHKAEEGSAGRRRSHHAYRRAKQFSEPATDKGPKGRAAQAADLPHWPQSAIQRQSDAGNHSAILQSGR
jgi:chromosome partitioning protein